MKITDHIHALKIPFQIPVGPGKNLARFVYVYFVLGRETVLIDSGVKGSESIIFEYLEDLGRDHEEISLLLLTHAHPDHIGAAATVKKKTSCLTAAHKDARGWIEDVEQQFKERPVPGFHNLVGGSTGIDRILQDGDVVDLGPVTLEIIHTPGHAKGSISLYSKEEGVLLTGDAVLQKNDLPIYDDAAAAAASIKRLKNITDINYLLASWTDPLEGGAAHKMLDEGLAYLQEIHAAVRKIASSDDTADPMELCARAVKILGLPDIAVNPLIARSIASHLPVMDLVEL